MRTLEGGAVCLRLDDSRRCQRDCLVRGVEAPKGPVSALDRLSTYRGRQTTAFAAASRLPPEQTEPTHQRLFSFGLRVVRRWIRKCR